MPACASSAIRARTLSIPEPDTIYRRPVTAEMETTPLRRGFASKIPDMAEATGSDHVGRVAPSPQRAARSQPLHECWGWPGQTMVLTSRSAIGHAQDYQPCLTSPALRSAGVRGSGNVCRSPRTPTAQCAADDAVVIENGETDASVVAGLAF
jgi:hypothetical protein